MTPEDESKFAREERLTVAIGGIGVVVVMALVLIWIVSWHHETRTLQLVRDCTRDDRGRVVVFDGRVQCEWAADAMRSEEPEP